VAVRGETGQKTTTVFPLARAEEMKARRYVIKAKDGSGGRDLARRRWRRQSAGPGPTLDHVHDMR